MEKLIRRESETPSVSFVVDMSSTKEVKEAQEKLTSLIGENLARQVINTITSIKQRHNFVNQCNKATHEFGNDIGNQLSKTGQTFKFTDARNYCNPNNSYLGKFHSVRILETNRNQSLIIDLTFRPDNNQTIQFILVSGGTNSALDELGRHYGGIWNADFTFNKETGRVIFND